jgi:hypothetical protein
MKPTSSELSENERNWIAEQLAGAAEFIETFSPPDTGAISLAALDRAFASWLATAESDTQAINKSINLVGIAFGQSLVDVAGFEWVIATDEQGSDIAVLALPDTGRVLVYPTDFIAKRWEQGECDFLQASFRTIARQVEVIGQEHASAKAMKPRWKLW